MSFKPIRIASRQSPLAVAQAELVATMLADALGVPADNVEEAFPLTTYVTTGDKAMNPSLADIGGKGLFTKEIELALLNGDADIAVHSMKDMPAEMPPGLTLAATPPREIPQDAFVTLDGRALADMKAGERVGTSSVRRSAQLRGLRPDLTVVPMRGNVGTRLKKLAAKDADATFLAEAGLRRLGHDNVRRVLMPVETMLPAPGQGILCVQGRLDAPDILEATAKINCQTTSLASAAERALIRVLDGSCRTPIAGLAQVEAETVSLRGEILTTDGARALVGERRFAVDAIDWRSSLAQADTAGQSLGRHLAEEAGPELVRMLHGS